MVDSEFLRNYQIPEGSLRLDPDEVALCMAIQRDSQLTDAEFAAAATAVAARLDELAR